MINNPGNSSETPDLSSIRIDKNNIYKALGMKEENSDEHISLLIDQYIDKSKKLGKPCIAFSIFENPGFDRKKGELYLNGLTFSLGKQVVAFLSKSSRIIIFTVTCGDGIEKFSKNLVKEGHMLEGLVVDIIGSELAEELAEYLYQKVEQTVGKENLKITNRYSPGYCNWPVSDQQNLFALMSDNNCGIQLNSSSLMLPIKSVSGMIGIGREVKKLAYKCQLCYDVNCIMRREKI